MTDRTANHTQKEKVTHPNQSFPISEFVDQFDAFPGGCIQSHWHPELEIQIILKGSAQYRVNGTDYLVEEGCAIYITPEAIHMAKALSGNTIGYNIVLLPQLLTGIMRSANHDEYVLPLTTRRPESLVITPERKEGHRILDALKKIYNAESSSFSYDLFLLEQLMGIWRNLLAVFPKNTENPGESSKLLRENRMKSMIDYIHQNYPQPITLQDIADATNVSKSECCRCFAELSDMTPMEYVSRFRLLQATQMLLSTEKPISDICFSIGFNNTSYFSKKFKEQYGMMPKAYRMKKAGWQHI